MRGQPLYTNQNLPKILIYFIVPYIYIYVCTCSHTHAYISILAYISLQIYILYIYILKYQNLSLTDINKKKERKKMMMMRKKETQKCTVMYIKRLKNKNRLFYVITRNVGGGPFVARSNSSSILSSTSE